MSDFPKLLWAPDGTEVTVCDQGEQDEKLGKGYRLTAQADPEPLPAHEGAPTLKHAKKAKHK